jgi:uncharacterized protein
VTTRIFEETPLRDVRPAGWIKRWLELQRHGLTGHLEVAGFPFDTKLWACPSIPVASRHGAPWWPYEQTAYWVDGFTRCGLLLDDPDLIDKARRQFDYVLSHADTSGYLGPKSCKAPMPAGRWSHQIFFRAMIAWFQATGDTRIVRALQRHYTGQRFDYSGHRDVCNIEIMCWVYARTGDRRLVKMAEETWAGYQATGEDDDRALRSAELAANRPASCHGVTFCETLKQAAILYMATGRKAYLRDAVNGMQKLDKWHMLPDGAPSSSESLRGITALDAHETCDIADYTWTAGYLLFATGEPGYADRIERAVFNALPGAVTKDFGALQYFSSPNQAVAARNSCHTLACAGGRWMSYRPKPGTECCTGEVNRVMPNYVSRMWLMRGEDPVAAMYGPSRFQFERGAAAVAITQETNYPFGEEIDFCVQTDAPVKFTLWLRIPGWCRGARISVNGVALRRTLRAGSFVPLARVFRQGDRVHLRLPMRVALRKWPGGGISVERGPLLFALPVPERRTVDNRDTNQSPRFPAWEMHPAGGWNYALALDPRRLDEQVRVEYGPWTAEPFSAAPVRLVVPARKVRGWALLRRKRLPSIGAKLVDPARNKWATFKSVARGDFLVTPPLPDPHTLRARLARDTEHITLVPHGCTLLRVGVFPRA